jgi:hypothetical protein
MNQKQQAVQRLEKLLEQDLENLKNTAIIKDGSKFYAFDRYVIEPESRQYRVTKYSCDVGLFDSLRSATSWCIADKYNQIQLCMDLKRLDHHKFLLGSDIAAREALGRRTQDPIRREIVDAKLATKKTQLRAISEQLDKCVNLAKYWQIRGFNNETARTGRTASNRTSR